MQFPADFVWGVASASYQIEGAADIDGKGPSVWDMFCRKPGAIWRGQNGDVACDHYHRFRDDVTLMQTLGIPNYRMSISWPRVLPEGVGAVNTRGLDFYDHLIDALLAAGVEPWVTLFHWDYPLALYQRGGWLNRDSADWFAEYTALVVDRFSDRVTHWIPQNEQPCFISLGMQTGYHAPGDQLAFAQVLRAAHHTLLAHGRAVQAIRAHSKRPARIGTALVAGPLKEPATDNPADVEAARAVTFGTQTVTCFNLHLWADRLFLGEYPADSPMVYGPDAVDIMDGDMKIIHQPLDFCGLNIYHSEGTIRAGADGTPEEVPLPPGYPKTTQDYWAITPRALYWGPKFYYERYGLPIVITENGHQNADIISLDGKVHDPQRIDYLHRYLREFARAGLDGVPIEGYFQWCFTDNFEWSMGDAIRVGLVFTDYPTQQRIPKDSAFWYSEVIQQNGAQL